MAGEEKPLQKDALTRLADARDKKAEMDADLREAYFFTAPQRCRDIRSENRTDKGRTKDNAALQVSIGMEVAGDFATEMLNTFTPEVIEWCQQKAGAAVPEDEVEEVSELISAQTTKIFAEIKAAGFYAAAAQAYAPDIALGTVGMFIDDSRPAEPTLCLPVPIKEIDINTGPDGKVDDRFITRHTRWRNVAALLPGVELPKELHDKHRDKPNAPITITWGWWRLWDRLDNVVWQSVILVDRKLVQFGTLVGAGSCPFIVGRFNPDVMHPWGWGPTPQSLPELRRLDEVEGLKIERFDFVVHPPFVYPDDGVLNFENGIEPGMGYPARPWASGRPFEPMIFDTNMSATEFEIGKIEQRIKRAHYADYPEQIGKTPPTAEQWLDELARAKRRIGTPGKIFFGEFPAEVFLRFKFLAEKKGLISPIEIDGQTVSLTPYDPTEQAQEHQDVQVANRLLEMARMYFPNIAEVQIDGAATLRNIKAKLRDKLVVIRDDSQVNGAIEQFGPLIAGAGGMPAPGVE